MNDAPRRKIITSDTFLKRLLRLKRRYPRIQDDIQPLLDMLVAGGMPGDLVSGVGADIFKVRVPNRDARRGKSGGYRVLYYLQTPLRVILLFVYSKSEMEDVPADVLRQLVAPYIGYDQSDE